MITQCVLLKQYSKSQYTIYQAIFCTPPLGDLKPSALLRYVADHLDSNEAQAPRPWFKWLWFSLLPEHIRKHLLSDAAKEGDDQRSVYDLAEHTSNDIRRIDAVASSRPAKSKLVVKKTQDADNSDWCFYDN